jgi:carboxyl-terminal processing protease
VIGSTSTYGKGTVQRSIGLDPESNFLSSNSELGSLKLTLQKFYRINGGSTQLKGVTPDIVLPDQYEYLRFRERDNENALPWDEISKAPYKNWNGGYDLQTIKNLSSSRVANSTTFRQIKEKTELLGKQNDKEYSLNIDKFRNEQKLVREAVKQLDTLLKLDKELNIAYLQEDIQRRAADKDKQDRYNQWLKNLSKDIYLDQAVKVVTDIQNQRNLANRQPKKEAIKSF